MSQVPIRDSVGAALRFLRENWQFVVSVAAIAALAQGAFLLLGPNLAWMAAVLLAVLGAHTAITSVAIGAPRPVAKGLVANAARVGAAMAMIGFFLGILFFALSFITVTALIAPYQEQVKAAGEDQAALQQIMEQALQGQPNVMFWAVAAGTVLLFAVTTRFYVAAPATIDRKRITVFESWRMTRGNFLRIAGARLLLLGPAFIFVSALQSLLATGLGAPTADPISMLTYAQGNPLGFALFYTASIFLQIVIYSALEAALSARIYRALAPAPA